MLLQKRYALKETDEFISPILLNKECILKENDAILFFNFRADRARQIIKAFNGELSSDFKRLI
jgi:2,3-bisphosphoglycerate-independent phosphoglycerate mutase